MKKFLILLCLCVFCFTSALAVEAPAYEDAMPGFYKPPVMKEGQYPIEEEGVKLSYWMEIQGNAVAWIDSYAKNPAYQKAEADTGVEIEYLHPAAGTSKEAFQLLFSGELPDMIQVRAEHWYNGGLQALYDDGIIIDVTPYLEQYAPQYLEVLNVSDTTRAQCYTDGKVLGFYKITHAPALPYNRVNVNKDWLDEMGVAEPVTIAEYEAYFDWVLANKPDVVPLYIGNLTTTSAQMMNLFTGAYDFLYDWYVDRDNPEKVRYWANSPHLKEYLTMMNEWYNKGYLGKDFLALTAAEAQALFDAGKLAAICDSVDATFNRVTALENGFATTNLPYMRKEKDSVLGSGLTDFPVSLTAPFVTVITSSCENVEAAVQYLNYGYTYEGAMPYNFGIENEGFVWGEDGLPKFTDLMINNPDGMTVSNTSYVLKGHFASRYCYPDNLAHPNVASKKEALANRTKWAGDTNEQNFLQLPPIKLTAEETAERAALMAQVDTYAKEMMLKFIMGAESLDNFDKYLVEVTEYGLAGATAITQAALDRYLGK